MVYKAPRPIFVVMLFLFLAISSQTLGNQYSNTRSVKSCSQVVNNSSPKQNSDFIERPRIEVVSQLDSKKQITPEDLIRAVDGEKRPIRLITNMAKFMTLSKRNQDKVISTLIEKGQNITLMTFAAFLKGRVQIEVVEHLIEEMPQFGILVISSLETIPARKKMELIQRGIENSSFGDLQELYSSLLYSKRPINTRHNTFGMRIFGFTVRTAAKLFPPFGRIVKKTRFEKLVATESEKATLFRRSLQQDPLSIIMAFTKSNITIDTPLDVPSESMDLRRTIVKFSNEYPEILPSKWVQIATEPVARREVSLGLIRQMYRLSGSEGEWVSPRDSIQVIADSSGLNYGIMSRVKYSVDTLSNFFNTVLEIQSRLKVQAFRNIEVEPQLLRDRKLKDLVDIFGQLKNLLFLRGNNDKVWEEIVREMGFSSQGITKANIQEIGLKLNEKITVELERIFQENGNSSFSLAEFNLLRERWVSIEDLLTLVARYNANSGWRHSIKALVKILRADIDGNFMDLKRTGDPKDRVDQIKAAAQTNILNTPAKEAAWWQQWNEVSLYKPRGNKRKKLDDKENSQALTSVKNNIENDLVPLVIPALREPKNAEDTFRYILNSKSNAKKILDELGAKDSKVAGSLVRMILNRIRNVDSITELQKALGYLKELLKWHPSLLVEGNGERFGPSLTSVYLQLKELSTLSSNNLSDNQIIVTTTSHSPRVALSLGSLVDAGSCMDPKFGLRADVIPFLALDANVQAIFSTALRENNFSSNRDFMRVASWIEKGSTLDIEFEGNSAVYSFTDRQSNVSVSTLPVLSAYIRHQLKFGTTKKGVPGIRTEREFSQSHLALSTMKAQIKSIKKKMAAAMGGEVDVEVKMPATRNLPGGAFSDAVHKKTGSGLVEKEHIIPKP